MADDIDARLEAARKRLAARQVEDERRRKEAELEALERKLRDGEVLDQMRAKHGAKNLAAVGYAEGLVVLRRGLTVDWTRFNASEKTDDDSLDFVARLLAYPETRDELEAILETYPQLLYHLTIEAAALYGNRRREIEGN
jgi:hypothetical protein